MDTIQILDALQALDDASAKIESMRETVIISRDEYVYMQHKMSDAARVLMEIAADAGRPASGTIFERIRRRTLEPREPSSTPRRRRR